MRIIDNVESLRSRFMDVRGDRSLRDLSLAIGISHATLAQFIADGASTRVPLMDKIEMWVEEQEGKQK